MSKGSRDTEIETVSNNKLALRSEVEIFGTTTNSASGEGEQIPWYKNASLRIKKRGWGGSAYSWWGRSPGISSTSYFCCVTSYGIASGSAFDSGASGTRGLAPFGCI